MPVTKHVHVYTKIISPALIQITYRVKKRITSKDLILCIHILQASIREVSPVFVRIIVIFFRIINIFNAGTHFVNLCQAKALVALRFDPPH